jgi:hypothetical protein
MHRLRRRRDGHARARARRGRRRRVRRLAGVEVDRRDIAEAAVVELFSGSGADTDVIHTAGVSTRR